MLPRVLDVPGLELLRGPAADRGAGGALARHRPDGAARHPALPARRRAARRQLARHGAHRRAAHQRVRPDHARRRAAAARRAVVRTRPGRASIPSSWSCSASSRPRWRRPSPAAGSGSGLASNARLAGDWRAVDIEPREGALRRSARDAGRVLVYPPRRLRLRARGRARRRTAARPTASLVAAALRPALRDLLARLRAERPTTRGATSGSPSADELPFVDAVVPADFDWRTADALPLVV